MTRRSSRRLPHTLGASQFDRFLLMLTVLAETAAQEGKKVIFAMLIVGLIFLSVIALGELTHWLRSRR